jgi:hypothetical protein
MLAHFFSKSLERANVDAESLKSATSMPPAPEYSI